MQNVQERQKTSLSCQGRLARVRTIKAREHHGAQSLDLTVPADFCREFSIQKGDVFEVSVESDGERLVLTYTRVFPES